MSDDRHLARPGLLAYPLDTMPSSRTPKKKRRAQPTKRFSAHFAEALGWLGDPFVALPRDDFELRRIGPKGQVTIGHGFSSVSRALRGAFMKRRGEIGGR